MPAGRHKKYTKKALNEAVQAYFESISRTVTATERYETGNKDSDGHAIWGTQDICNDAGEPIRYKEYVLPPTVGGLCSYLVISRETWDSYCDPKRNPQFLDTTTRARGRMFNYCENELLTRPGKDLKGVIFNLENNYGYSDRHEMELGPKTRAAEPLTTEEKVLLLKRMSADLADAEAGDGEDG